MIKRQLSIFFVILLIITFLHFENASAQGSIKYTPADDFIRVKGTWFSGDFKFIGVNADPWRFITTAGEVYSQDEIRAWVKNAVSHTGAKVYRMHINGGAFEPSIGKYNEQAFKQLDYLIAACVEYKIRIIIALRDYVWTPWPPSAFDPYWYFAGGTKNNPNKDAILNSAEAKGHFKNFIKYVLARKNTVTGTIYKDDKNIFAWELINEPRVTPGQTGAWLVEFGKFVKSIDPNHLVTVAIGGAELEWWEPGRQNWQEVNIKEIDFLDLHYYADANLYTTVNKNTGSRLKSRIESALSLKKPVIIGEFGCLNTVDLTTIMNLYKVILTTSFANGASGCLPYSWGTPGPNGWGKKGGFVLYTADEEINAILKNFEY